MSLVGWPATVDDTGSGQDGTVLDAAFFAAQKTSIENEVLSATNPTVKPKTITDEVIAARGTMPSLDARLDVSLNEDGTPKVNALLPTLVQLQSQIGAKNLCPNDTMLLWSAGDAGAPDYFTLSGAGAAVARCGTGLGDTTVLGYGDFCAKVTFGAASAKLTHALLTAAEFARAGGLKGRKIAFGAKVKCAVAGIARIVVDDGITTGASTFHTGAGGIEWLSVMHTMSGSATKLSVYLEVAGAGAAYIGAWTVLLADLAPADWTPCAMQKGFLHFAIAGAVAVGALKGYAVIGAPAIVTDVQVHVLTAPTGATLLVDVNSWDGAAFTSMFAAALIVAIAAKGVGGVPDGTYARRCLAPNWGTATPVTGSMVSYDVDQVGSAVTGSDLVVEVRIRQYIRELEQLLAFDSL